MLMILFEKRNCLTQKRLSFRLLSQKITSLFAMARKDQIIFLRQSTDTLRHIKSKFEKRIHRRASKKVAM